jgi:diguanylate cyclase (GGDEF)-like protein
MYRGAESTRSFTRPTGPLDVVPPLGPGTPAVVVLAGDGIGNMHTVPKMGELVIGRDPTADIPVTDISVSRRHATVVDLGDRVVVRELGSRNGTWVDGVRIDGEQDLHEGSKLRIGAITVLKFTMLDAVDQQYQQRMVDAARIDPLTGCLNRRGLAERLEAEISASHRSGAPLSLLMLDLDHFKRHNDTLGHYGGDLLLKHVVQIVGAALRKEDTLARYGGDEFVVIVRGGAAGGAPKLAERLRAQVASTPCDFEGSAVYLTVSIGVAQLAPDTGAKELLYAADSALYLAKRGGRDRVA